MTGFLQPVTLLIFLAFAIAANANGRYVPTPSDMASCYDPGSAHAGVHISGLAKYKPAVGKQILVMVDRTMDLKGQSKRQLAIASYRFIKAIRKPGDRLVLASFASLNQAGYPAVDFDQSLDRMIPANRRKWIGNQTLQRLKLCIHFQNQVVTHYFARAFRGVWDRITPKAPYSPILSTLRFIGGQINPKQGRPIILYVSDLMEYSDGLKFYRHHHLRNIDPAKVFSQPAVKEALKGVNLRGAEVYVLGVGFNATRGNDSQGLAHLKDFWRRVFKAAGGHVVEMHSVSLTPKPE